MGKQALLFKIAYDAVRGLSVPGKEGDRGTRSCMWGRGESVVSGFGYEQRGAGEKDCGLNVASFVGDGMFPDRD